MREEIENLESLEEALEMLREPFPSIEDIDLIQAKIDEEGWSLGENTLTISAAISKARSAHQ